MQPQFSLIDQYKAGAAFAQYSGQLGHATCVALPLYARAFSCLLQLTLYQPSLCPCNVFVSSGCWHSLSLCGGMLTWGTPFLEVAKSLQPSGMRQWGQLRKDKMVDHAVGHL